MSNCYSRLFELLAWPLASNISQQAADADKYIRRVMTSPDGIERALRESAIEFGWSILY